MNIACTSTAKLVAQPTDEHVEKRTKKKKVIPETRKTSINNPYRSTQPNKPGKTYAQLNPVVKTKYNVVKLKWDQNNSPVVECSNETNKLNEMHQTKESCFIFVQHSAIVKIAEDTFLNTSSGEIIKQSSNPNKKIEWDGCYSKKYARPNDVFVYGDEYHPHFNSNHRDNLKLASASSSVKTKISTAPKTDLSKNHYGIFESDSTSDTDSYAGTSDEENFFSAKSSFSTSSNSDTN